MRRAERLALALVFAASSCAVARADPPLVRGREVAPGLRWIELRERFADARGRLFDAEWVVARVDLARRPLAILRSPNDHVAAVTRGRDVVLSINAGFFEPDHRPSGVLQSHGRVFGGPGPRGGSGVLVLEGGRARLLEREALDGGVGFGATAVAVQCGPRLIERDGAVGIHRDDGRRFARTIACIRDQGRTLDLIATWRRDAPLEGPGLLELAQRLSRPDPSAPRGCEAALNLDGGPSTGVAVRAPRWRFTHESLGPTPWLIVARR